MPRYIPTGKTRWFLVPTLANPAVPKATEISAGTPLHDVLRSYSGFTAEHADADSADLGSTWDKTVPSTRSASASSMTLYAGDAAADEEETVRAALTPGDDMFVVRCHWGAPTATQPCDVFPVIVKHTNTDAAGRTDVATYTVGFSIHDDPSIYVDIVAGP